MTHARMLIIAIALGAAALALATNSMSRKPPCAGNLLSANLLDNCNLLSPKPQ